jgi:hypothetical protein
MLSVKNILAIYIGEAAAVLTAAFILARLFG